MATAIVWTYTDDGFVIAADGMAKELDGSVTTRTRQKIFAFGGDRSLAFSFAGRVGIGPDEGPDVWFDFRKQIDEAVQAVSMNRFATLSAYADRLGKRAHRALKEICTSEHITFDDTTPPNPTERGITLAHVFINGYFKQFPGSVTVRFYRENQRFAEPEIFNVPLNHGMTMRHGSQIVRDLMDANDPRFCNETYIRPIEDPMPQYLTEAMLTAMVYARGYIEASSERSPVGMALDEKACSGIGGHIHMASITPAHGFQWVPEFEPTASGHHS